MKYDGGLDGKKKTAERQMVLIISETEVTTPLNMLVGQACEVTSLEIIIQQIS